MYRFQRWKDTLQIAPNEGTVVGVMRDYVAAIEPEVIATLPVECKRAMALSDIQSAAVTLLHAELMYRGTPEIGELLHEIAHTFAAASVRLSRLRGQSALVPTSN